MHEATIAHELLLQLRELSHSHEDRPLGRVTVEVGRTSGIDPEALRLAFQALAPGTCAAQASLEIHPIPTRLSCRACMRHSEPDTPFAACPLCGSTQVDIVAGQELLIRGIDLLPAPSPLPPPIERT